DLLRLDAQGLGGSQQADDLGVVHGHRVNGDAGILLKVFVESGNIVAQLVQFEQGVVQVLKFEVGGQQAALDVVGRVLNGTEVINVEGIRDDDHAAGVLAGGALDTGTADAQAVFLGTVDGAA